MQPKFFWPSLLLLLVFALPVQAMDQSSGQNTANGKAVYENTCAACHSSGVLGAPPIGDQKAWKERIAQGMQTLYDHAIHGFQQMPAKGGNPSLSDDQVKAAVQYMVDRSK